MTTTRDAGPRIAGRKGMFGRKDTMKKDREDRMILTRAVPAIAALVLAVSSFPTSACGQGEEAGAQAIPTRVMVRVIARDAKIIGSGVGGVEVRVVNAETGELLARGQQQGGTGDTRRIMTMPHERGMTVYDTEGAAGFLAEIPLDEPTMVNISASGPLDYPQAMASASKNLLLVPGEHVEGDGVILELHGFIVEILSPEPMTPLGARLEVTARVHMMCGCPIEPGGLWDANAKTFTARLWSQGSVVATAPLEFTGETSMFSGTLQVPSAARGADSTLEVIVSESGKQNFGRHEIPLGG